MDCQSDVFAQFDVDPPFLFSELRPKAVAFSHDGLWFAAAGADLERA